MSKQESAPVEQLCVCFCFQIQRTLQMDFITCEHLGSRGWDFALPQCYEAVPGIDFCCFQHFLTKMTVVSLRTSLWAQAVGMFVGF